MTVIRGYNLIIHFQQTFIIYNASNKWSGKTRDIHCNNNGSIDIMVLMYLHSFFTSLIGNYSERQKIILKFSLKNRFSVINCNKKAIPEKVMEKFGVLAPLFKHRNAHNTFQYFQVYFCRREK